MQRIFRRPAQWLVIHRVNPQRRLKGLGPVDGSEHTLGKILRRSPPAVQTRHDLAGHIFLHGNEWIVRGGRPSAGTHLFGPPRDWRHHRIGIRKHLVLQTQRVPAPDQIG